MAAPPLPGQIASPDAPDGPDLTALAPQILARISGLGPFRLAGSLRDGATFTLDDSQGHPLGALYVNAANSDAQARFRTRDFNISIGNFSASPETVDTLVHAARVVAEWDGGARSDGDAHLAPEDLTPLNTATLATVWLAFLLGICRRSRVIVDFRLPHLLQVIAQGSIFLYWALYWPGVRDHLPSLALQIVFGYACDAVFCLLRFRSWRVGLSVLPVVLSTNLFEWFDWHALLIAFPIAFGSKVYLHRKGRHIFNPSVAGLVVVAVVSVLRPDFVHFGSDFHTLNIPPNMAEFVLLAALVPQLRYRIVPISIGGILALYSTGNPALVRPAIILAVSLLASDPATTPATDVGKILFGCIVGFGLPIFSIVMRRIGQPDDFAKVLAVAVGNAFAPSLDSAARAATGTVARTRDFVARSVVAWKSSLASRVEWAAARLSRPIPNVALVGCWLIICIPMIVQEKSHDFEPALHWNWNTPLVVRDSDGVPRCSSNPVFCQPFSFGTELTLWWKRLHETPAVMAAEAATPATLASRDRQAVQGKAPAFTDGRQWVRERSAAR